MTRENVRRLYKHYVEVKNKKACEDLLKKRAWLREEVNPSKPKAKPEVKKNEKSKR